MLLIPILLCVPRLAIQSETNLRHGATNHLRHTLGAPHHRLLILLRRPDHHQHLPPHLLHQGQARGKENRPRWGCSCD